MDPSEPGPSEPQRVKQKEIKKNKKSAKKKKVNAALGTSNLSLHCSGAFCGTALLANLSCSEHQTWHDIRVVEFLNPTLTLILVFRDIYILICEGLMVRYLSNIGINQKNHPATYEENFERDIDI